MKILAMCYIAAYFKRMKAISEGKMQEQQVSAFDLNPPPIAY